MSNETGEKQQTFRCSDEFYEVFIRTKADDLDVNRSSYIREALIFYSHCYRLPENKLQVLKEIAVLFL